MGPVGHQPNSYLPLRNNATCHTILDTPPQAALHSYGTRRALTEGAAYSHQARHKVELSSFLTSTSFPALVAEKLDSNTFKKENPM